MPRRAATLDVTAILSGLQSRRTGTVTSPSNPDNPDGALLDAAAELMTRYGLRRWSMEEVAEVAGVGRATLYRRFPSRDDLVNAAIAREANRFFSEVAAAVASTDGVVEKVVEGFLVGMRIARESLVPGLFENDRSTALSLFTAAPVLELGRAALVAQYRALAAFNPRDQQAAEIELVAEVLVRLAMSFVLIPGSVIDFEDPGKTRRALTRIVRPLLLPPENAPRPRPPRRPARR